MRFFIENFFTIFIWKKFDLFSTAKQIGSLDMFLTSADKLMETYRASIEQRMEMDKQRLEIERKNATTLADLAMSIGHYLNKM